MMILILAVIGISCGTTGKLEVQTVPVKVNQPVYDRPKEVPTPKINYEVHNTVVILSKKDFKTLNLWLTDIRSYIKQLLAIIEIYEEDRSNEK